VRDQVSHQNYRFEKCFHTKILNEIRVSIRAHSANRYLNVTILTTPGELYKSPSPSLYTSSIHQTPNPSSFLHQVFSS